MTPFAVLNQPHASTAVPPELRGQLRLSSRELNRELLRMTDWYTDELFSPPDARAAAVRFPVSRLVLDPERYLDDRQEVMAARGMGVVYTRTSDGARLRERLSPAERQELIDRFYSPHHAAVSHAVDAALAEHGACLIVDCHSFPSRPLPYELDQRPDRPDVCLGTDRTHTPTGLLEAARVLFDEVGLDLAIDRPFSGSFVPAKHLGRTPSVFSIMIELKRSLYMDERTGAKRPEFAVVAARMRQVVMGLIDACRSLRPTGPSNEERVERPARAGS